MRNQYIYLALAIMLLSPNARSQWVQTNGPFGGGVYCLAEYDNNVFAGTAWGIYLSTDNGTSWTSIYAGSTIFLGCMAVIPNETGGIHLFGGYSSFRSGLFRLTSGDNIWAFDSLILDEAIFDLAVSGANVYAGTRRGVLLSTDYGESWTQMNNGLPPNTCIRTISAIPNGSDGTNLFAVPEGNGVFLSTDNGTTWTLANSGLSSSVRCFAIIDTNLFAGTSGSGVFRSTNNGTTWSAVNTGIANMTIHNLAVIGENLFALGRSPYSVDSIFLSTDNGESWTEVNPGLPLINPRVICLIASGTNLWAGSYGGVFLSTNSGTSWTLANHGLSSSSINCFAVSGTNIFAGTEENGVFLSTDNGSSWSSINSGLKDNFIRALAIGGTNLLAGTASGVFLSTNDGESWTEVNSGLTNIWIRSIVVAGTNLFVGTEGGGVFRSTDNGTSWTAASINLTNKIVYSLAVMDSHLFAGTWGGGVFVSTNNGTSWTGVNSGLQDAHIGSFAVSGPNLFTSTGSGICVSSNNGTTWSSANAPFFSFTQMLERGSYLYAGTGGMGAFDGGGVYVSTDNGRSWTAVNTGLTHYMVGALAVSGTNLFAGTSDGGVWRRPLSEMITDVAQGGSGIPTAHALQQNYPNPFNPSTTIRYGLPSRSLVTLAVFNTLGQQVATLVEGEMEAGFHEAVFDASGLASGVYLYRLTAGSFVEARKLVLVR
ncbi:MAG: T9SS C-terminal target domain-containing protein [Nitrospiraceae bacterium]|nr:MAG: T9SS C-terminal target domain-containing protein [Nitrospiraceae bacterium]